MHALLQDAGLYDLLLAIDLDLAASAQAAGCPACGGRLHSAKYPRVPRGGPSTLPPEYARRFSFCCDRDGCRRRVTSPSVRYLGRRVYLGAVVVLMTAMQAGINPQRATHLRKLLGVGIATLRRWREWWTQTFAGTAFWRLSRNRLMPPVAGDRLPASLLERFQGPDERCRLAAMLSFLWPLTTGSVSLSSSLAMVVSGPQKMN